MLLLLLELTELNDQHQMKNLITGKCKRRNQPETNEIRNVKHANQGAVPMLTNIILRSATREHEESN